MTAFQVLDGLLAWWRGGELLMPVILATGLVLYARIGTLAWTLFWCGVLSPGERSRARNDRSAVVRELILIRVLAAVLPLLGLLGTVAGMVQTFGDLSHSGGAGSAAASGIGLALTATQYGIALAIPALLAAALLQRRAQVLDARADSSAEESGKESSASTIDPGLEPTQHDYAATIPALLAEVLMRRRAQALNASPTPMLTEPRRESSC